jgi:hypothetical protein
VVLMGAAVGNGSTGTITADNGTVALASGRKITLDLVGDGLTNLVIAPDAMATSAAVGNSGTIQADGGRVALVGSSITVGELVVNQTGTVRARSIGTRNGEIFLGGGRDNQVAMTGGTLDATGAAAGERGGTIRIAAGQVKLEATTKARRRCSMPAGRPAAARSRCAATTWRSRRLGTARQCHRHKARAAPSTWARWRGMRCQAARATSCRRHRRAFRRSVQ